MEIAISARELRPLSFGDNKLDETNAIKAPKLAYLLASGDPMVLQIKYSPDKDGSGARGPSDVFLYLTIGHTQQNTDNEIIQAELHPVQCSAKDVAAESEATPPAGGHLFDGMAVSEGSGCMASNAAAVRDAAANSQGDRRDLKILRWVRAGDQ